MREFPPTAPVAWEGRAIWIPLDAADAWFPTPSRGCVKSIFNWIGGKTGIEIASKARSSRGLLIHVLGRLAIAMLVRSALPQSA